MMPSQENTEMPMYILESTYKNDPAPMPFSTEAEAREFMLAWQDYAEYLSEARRKVVISDWVNAEDMTLPESMRIMSRMALSGLLAREREWRDRFIQSGGDLRITTRMWPTEYPIRLRVVGAPKDSVPKGRPAPKGQSQPFQGKPRTKGMTTIFTKGGPSLWGKYINPGATT